jgi:hypothetical protein
LTSRILHRPLSLRGAGEGPRSVCLHAVQALRVLSFIHLLARGRQFLPMGNICLTSAKSCQSKGRCDLITLIYTPIKINRHSVNILRILYTWKGNEAQPTERNARRGHETMNTTTNATRKIMFAEGRSPFQRLPQLRRHPEDGSYPVWKPLATS